MLKNPSLLRKWSVVLVIAAVCMLLPYTEFFDLKLHLFLTITAACLIVTCLDLLPLLLISVLMPTLYYVCGIAPLKSAFGGWCNDTTWIVLGALVLSDGLIETGILKRIAYWVIAKLGYSYQSVIYGVVLAGIILAFLTSRNASWCLGAACVGLCDAFGLKKHTKEASLIMMAGAVSTLAIGTVCYYPATVGLLAAGGANVIPGYDITYVQLLVDNLPYLFFPFLYMFVMLKLDRPQVTIHVKDYVEQERANMGPLSIQEKRSAVVMGLIFLYVLTSSLHKLPISYAFMIGPWLLYVPGLQACDPASLKKANFPMVAFVAACLGIGIVSGELGLGDKLSDLLMPLMSGLNPVAVILVIWLVGFTVHFAMTPLAVYAAFAEPIALLTHKLGLNISVGLYTLMDGAYQHLLPYENTAYLFYYSLGYMRLKDFIRTASVMTLLALVYHMVIIVPYWMLIGLL